MAIQIGGTTVIDNSRNIQNIGVATVTSVSIGSTQVISSTFQLQNITSIAATGPVLIGTATSTGTANQALQVGSATTQLGAYVSGNLGVGVTLPTSSLSVSGSGNFTGIVTASSFSGNLGNTLTLNTTGIGLTGLATFNNSGAATFTVTSNATSANTGSTIVSRDASGDFSAGTITANLNGSATTVTSGAVAKAWVNFGSPSPYQFSPLIRASYNVSSVSYVSAGRHTINFTNSFPNGDYSVVATKSQYGTSAPDNGQYIIVNGIAQSASSLGLLYWGVIGGGGAYSIPDIISVVVFS